MTLSDITTISGKGGLFKIVKSSKSGVIVESLDENKARLMATANHKVSVLSDISIYTTSKDGSLALQQVLEKIYKDYGTDIGLNVESEANELKAFMKSVVPDFDEARVYISDIKKLIKWYTILYKHAPEIFSQSSNNSENENKEAIEQ